MRTPPRLLQHARKRAARVGSKPHLDPAGVRAGPFGGRWSRSGWRKQGKRLQWKCVYYESEPVDEGDNTAVRRVPLEGGEKIRIIESVCSEGFAVAERGIYFFSGCENPSFQRFNFVTRKVETVAKNEGNMAYGFSVSPDGRWLLYAEYDNAREQSDLMMVDKFR